MEKLQCKSTQEKTKCAPPPVHVGRSTKSRSRVIRNPPFEATEANKLTRYDGSTHAARKSCLLVKRVHSLVNANQTITRGDSNLVGNFSFVSRSLLKTTDPVSAASRR